MIRKSALSRHQKPLYRQIIRDAFVSAWKNRSLWPLALFAMILQSGGIMDSVFYSVNSLSNRLTDNSNSMIWSRCWAILMSLFNATDGASFLSAISAVQNLVIALIFLFAILGMSVISQGALIFGLGRVFRGQKPNLHESLRAGAKAFQPVAVLNLISYVVMWAGAALLLIPAGSYLANPSMANIVLYFICLLAFIAIAITMTTVHLFTLNSIIFNQTSLMDSLKLGFQLLRQHWLIVLELSLILLAIGFGLLVGGFVAFLVAGIPLFIFMVVFNVLSTDGLFYITYLIAGMCFIVIMLSAGALHVTLQYATWERLYQRTASGNPLARITRWFHWLFHMK